MEIRFLKHREIDRQKWDACIGDAANSLIYAYSWYLDIAAPRWNALVLNDYEAVMPLPTVKKLFTVAYQPFFTQQLGVFFRAGAAFNTDDFFGRIPSGYRYINVCINEKNDPGRLPATVRSNHLLDLDADYRELSAGFSEHCRRNIRKASKAGLNIAEATPDEVVAFYIRHKGDQTENIGAGAYETLKKLLHGAASRQMLDAVKVTADNGELLACAAWYVQPGRIIYQVGASGESGREARAMYLLFGHMLEKYSGRPLAADFEGSDIPGIARFFRGFGAVPVPYHRIVINRLPWPFRLLKK